MLTVLKLVPYFRLKLTISLGNASSSKAVALILIDCLLLLPFFLCLVLAFDCKVLVYNSYYGN